MYTRVAGTSFVAGATGAALAKTGFPAFGLALLALCMLVSGLVLVRIAALRRVARAGEHA